MNDKKIAILFISVVIGLCGIFRAAVLNADSYTSGGSTPTLQQVIDKGSTASGAIVLSATSTANAISCSHGLGTGNCFTVTANTGNGSAFSASIAAGTGYVLNGWNSGSEDSISLTQIGNGDAIQIDNNGSGQGITIDQSAAGGIGLYVNSHATALPVAQFNGSTASSSGSGQVGIYAFGNGWGLDILGETTYGMTNWAGPFRVAYGDNFAAEHQIYEMNNAGFMAIGTGSDIDAQDIIFASSTVSKSGMTLRNTHSDANGINLEFDRAPVGGSADNDVIADIVFKGINSTGAVETYGKITSMITDNTDGTEDASICFSAMVNGVFTQVDCINGDPAEGSIIKYLGFATGTNSITVATGTAPLGVSIFFGAHMSASITAGHDCALNMPISVNGVDLSTSGAPDARYHIIHSIGGAADFYVNSNFYLTTIYAVADGWNPNITNVIDIGTPWTLGTCAATVIANQNITVYGLK
jgi:hypothetical protein